MPGRVAADQLGEVEVVARVHAHAGRQQAAQRDLLAGVEQRHLDAVDLRGVRADHRRADVGRARVVGIARESARADPVAGERRIEHLAQPVQDHRRAHLRQHAAVDGRVVVGRARARGERAARHQDDAAARGLDRRALLLVGGDHALERHVRRRRAGDRCRHRRRRPRPARARASATLRRISSSDVGQSRPMPRCAVSIASATPKPERPQVAAKRERRVPVDRRGRATGRRRRADRRRRARRRTRRGSSAARRRAPATRAARAACRAAARRRGWAGEVSLCSSRPRSPHPNPLPASGERELTDADGACTRMVLPLPARGERAGVRGASSRRHVSRLTPPTPARRPSAARASSAARVPRAARPWRLRAGSSGTGRRRRRGAGTAPTRP